MLPSWWKNKKIYEYQIRNTKYENRRAAITKQFLTKDDAQRSRYFLKIQDGCEQFCAYCIIPYTRGKLQSRPLAEVIAEVESAVKAGWQEIVLTGIHLGLSELIMSG